MRVYNVVWLLPLLLILAGCNTRAPNTPGNTVRRTETSSPQISQRAHLTISLDRSFPEKCADSTPLRANYEAVARDVLEVVHNRFGGVEPLDVRPIVCYLNGDPYPITDGTRDPAIIWIGIYLPQESLETLDYGRFTYQLGHELGHVMMDSRRTNGLIETIADGVSYQTLDDMAELWSKKYPDSHAWKHWAPHFIKYRQKMEQKRLKHFPPDIQTAVAQGNWSVVTTYLRHHSADLDRDPYTDEGANGLALRALGAMALRSQPVPWESFIGLATLTNPSPEEDGRNRDDLQTDLSRASSEVRAAVARFR